MKIAVQKSNLVDQNFPSGLDPSQKRGHIVFMVCFRSSSKTRFRARRLKRLLLVVICHTLLEVGGTLS